MLVANVLHEINMNGTPPVTVERLDSNAKSQSTKADAVSASTLPTYEGNIGSLTSLTTMPYSGSTFAFLPEAKTERMVTWHSQRLRKLLVCLGFFIVVALVMTGLFVWRMVHFSSKTDHRDKYLKNRTQVFVSIFAAVFILYVL